ncbi:MAG: hypothetical protein P3B76_03165 [Gemmatimonadota bacterium]|nr:hypothetical protein [Gemmatimonadota bacterium]MDQ8166880.1 hypothetical protein [Gemmatimonadota bacterium]MDQ8171664.1 hypothetical protein [Gemmatimonadota bacterium]
MASTNPGGPRLRRSVGWCRISCTACGVLDHGCARIRCDACTHEYWLTFSCKCRSFCPSCHAQATGERDLTVGIVACLQTHGSLTRMRANWHPHPHLLVTDGGCRLGGAFVSWRPRGDVRRARRSHRSGPAVPAGPESPARTAGRTVHEAHRHGGHRAAARSPVFARQGTGAYTPLTSIEFPFLGDPQAVVDDQRRRSGHRGAVIPPFRLTRPRTS